MNTKQEAPYLRKAEHNDVDQIWAILQKAIERRAADGSSQWQDGYPNKLTVESDIARGIGYCLIDQNRVVGYCAVIENDEPAYEAIQGKWLSEGDFIVVHRVAIAEGYTGKGYAKTIFRLLEEHAKSRGIYSIKVDTNFDNMAMLAIVGKLAYSYCGEVFFRGSSRKAFEKLLS